VDAVIQLDGLRKRYGAVEALRGLTAEIGGQKIGLLGQNGAGKSTLLKVLLGFEPAEGKARVLGFDPRRDVFAIRERVGYMPESDSYLPAMNAVELCQYAAELSGLPPSAAMQRAHAALYYANLEDKRYQPVAGYSTGQKQRVKLAQALVHDPELLFLDEPTNGLDPRGREEMLEIIEELPVKRGCTVILSTHLLPDVERLCDHVVMLHKGEITFSGTMAALRGADAERYEVRTKDRQDELAAALVRAGCTCEPLEDVLGVILPAGADSTLIFKAALDAKVQLRHMAPARATLEAAFLRAVGGAS
jgi:ABC-2 type transport system ATP-binding protein